MYDVVSKFSLALNRSSAIDNQYRPILTFGQSIKASSAIFVFLETLTEVREEQPLKAQCPISVTDGGILMLVREEQPSKALSPIFVTDGGILMLVREEQNEKAQFPIFVTDGGMVILVREEQA